MGAENTRKPFCFSCDVCNKKFRHPERFEAHQLEHEGKTVSALPWICSESLVYKDCVKYLYGKSQYKLFVFCQVNNTDDFGGEWLRPWFEPITLISKLYTYYMNL